MQEGYYYSREEIQKLEKSSNEKYLEKRRKIDVAFNAMIINVISTVIALMLLVAFIIVCFTQTGKVVYQTGVVFVVFSIIALYSSKVREENQVN